MKIAAVLFITLSVFFELLLSGNGLLGSQYTFPALLILFGAYMIISRSGLVELRSKRSSVDESSSPEIQQ